MLSDSDFDRIADEAVLGALEMQLAAGVDIVTDGEQRRDNFYSFVADSLDGVRLMSLMEMLDYLEDRAAFERLLQARDVPTYAVNFPVCIGRIERRRPLAVAEVSFLKQHTDRPIKISLPGPYLLTSAMWVPELTSKVYSGRADLAKEIVRILREEACEVAKAGADFIQFDEPALTELVFAQGHTRTFMCAPLTAYDDATEELEFAVGLINQVVDGLDGVRTGVHVCRGNWTRNEQALLRGGYAPLKPWFDRMHVDQLVLEYATPRAGDLLAFMGKELGLGLVNPRCARIETPEEIVQRVREAVKLMPIEAIFLNPDSGFGSFAAIPMNEPSIVAAKLNSLCEAARMLRAEFSTYSSLTVTRQS